MKYIRLIKSKIVKKDGKYQVQSEKGRNLGTYDTKEEAEKRLKQVEYFKHKKSSDEKYNDFLRKLQLVGKEYDVDINKINYETLDLLLHDYDGDRNIPFKILLDFDLDSFQEEYKGNYYEPYEEAYYDDYFLDRITIIEIDGEEVKIDIPVDSEFGQWIYESTEEHYRFNEDYFPQPPENEDFKIKI